jgi:hypothetical protein
MIDRRGIIEAVNRAVTRDVDTAGFKALAEMGMLDLAFEAIVLRYPHRFSKEAVEQSARRLRDWGQPQ